MNEQTQVWANGTVHGESCDSKVFGYIDRLAQFADNFFRSDGSKEWTPYWLNKLDHRFGNDGLFWMSYDDLCKRFSMLDRTRLFDNEWTVVQSWASVSVAWVTGYLNTKFVVEINKAGPTVFVLSQLDDRYFRGLEGKYSFDLHFILQEENSATGDHIVRARGPWFGNRSVSAEVTLQPGKYEVVPKIVADRDSDVPDVFEVVTKVADRNPQKLRQIGMNYDIANAKGIVQLSAEEKKKKEEKKKAAEEKKQKETEDAEKEKAEFEAWKKEKKERAEKEKEEQKEKEKEKEKTSTADAASETKTETKPDTDAPESGPKPASEEPPQGVQDTPTPTAPGPQPTTNEAVAKADHQPSKDLPLHPKIATTSRPAPSACEPSIFSAPPSPITGPQAPPMTYAASDAGPAATPPAASPAKEAEKKWNAICVLGLRVYSLDPGVSIKLVKPRSAEEGALLDVDGVVSGATMA